MKKTHRVILALDIIRSLEWVNENITEFGGNPDNVTIWRIGRFPRIIYDCLSASGLFHKAIVQSGGLNLTTKNVQRTSSKKRT